jgi:hypothetical protein
MSSEKSLYSRTAYREILKETVKFINRRNKGVKGCQNLTLLELAKTLIDHKPNKLIPTSLYDEINGKGSDAILPKDICSAMLKNKPEKRCSRKVKKPGDEFCFHHLKVIKDGGSVRTWDEYQTIKNKNYRGKRLKKLEEFSEYEDQDQDQDPGIICEIVYDTD